MSIRQEALLYQDSRSTLPWKRRLNFDFCTFWKLFGSVSAETGWGPPPWDVGPPTPLPGLSRTLSQNGLSQNGLSQNGYGML
eukprot:8359530-Heterocapsa_arctica.AAC.1